MGLHQMHLNISVISLAIIDPSRLLRHKVERLNSTPLGRFCLEKCIFLPYIEINCLQSDWLFFFFVFAGVCEERDWQPDLGGDCKDTLATYPRIAVTFQFNGWCVALWMITCNGNRTERENLLCACVCACVKVVITPGFTVDYLTLCWFAVAAGIHIYFYFHPGKQQAYLSAFSAGTLAPSIRRAFQTFLLLYFSSPEVLKLKVAIH